MSSGGSSPRSDHAQTTPFLLRLFYQTGSLFRPDEFASPSLPTNIPVYTSLDCTLNELALELASASPSALPSPAIGTRLVFQLVCPDLRNTSTTGYSRPRFAVKDLGNVVIGAGGPGVDLKDANEASAGKLEGDKTLSDAHFVVGDYVTCTVLPPLSDGSVAPASVAKREPIPSMRDGRGNRSEYSRDGGFGGRGGGRGGRPSWREERGRIPPGEWRRGERLPSGREGSFRGRGRGRW